MKMKATELFAHVIADAVKWYGKKMGAISPMDQLEVCDPQVSACGFTAVSVVFHCVCGDMTQMSCSPPSGKDRIREVRDYATDHPDEATVEQNFTDDEIEGDAENIHVASNMGQGVTDCSGCGRKLVGHWKLEGCSFVPEMEFPWDGQESPDSPASESSFSALKRLGSSVH
jgi:hypothetical protein